MQEQISSDLGIFTNPFAQGEYPDKFKLVRFGVVLVNTLRGENFWTKRKLLEIWGFLQNPGRISRQMQITQDLGVSVKPMQIPRDLGIFANPFARGGFRGKFKSVEVGVF